MFVVVVPYLFLKLRRSGTLCRSSGAACSFATFSATNISLLTELRAMHGFVNLAQWWVQARVPDLRMCAALVDYLEPRERIGLD
jgi:hypothetical protein